MGETTLSVISFWVDTQRSWAEVYWEEGGGWYAARVEVVGGGALAMVLKA